MVDHSFTPYKDNKKELKLIPENNVSDMNISLVDTFMNAEVLLHQGEKSKGYEGNNLVKAKVILYFCDEHGNIIGNANI